MSKSFSNYIRIVLVVASLLLASYASLHAMQRYESVQNLACAADAEPIEAQAPVAAAGARAVCTTPDADRKQWLRQQLPIASDISFSLWRELCLNFGKEKVSIIGIDYLHDARYNFIRACKAGVPADWFELDESRGFTDYFYVQKLVLAPTDTVRVFGDIHGDVRSLLAALQELAKPSDPAETPDLRDDFSLRLGAYFVFLGDYVDKGDYSLEVLYTLFRLKMKNPTQVILLRGNHENGGMQDSNHTGTLLYEFDKKVVGSYSDQGQSGAAANGSWAGVMGAQARSKSSNVAGTSCQLLYERYMNSLFNLMPVALYVGVPVPTAKAPERESCGSKAGCSTPVSPAGGDAAGSGCSSPAITELYKWILCCHGGPEIGFCARAFLKSGQVCKRIESLEVPKEMHQFPEKIQNAIRGVLVKNSYTFADTVSPRTSNSDSAINIGFLWNDFFDETDEQTFGFDRFRGFIIGQKLLSQLLKRDTVVSVIRGHQHAGWLGERLEEHHGYYPLYVPAPGYAPRVHTIVSGTDFFESTPFEYSFLELAQKDADWQIEHRYQDDQSESDESDVPEKTHTDVSSESV